MQVCRGTLRFKNFDKILLFFDDYVMDMARVMKTLVFFYAKLEGI